MARYLAAVGVEVETSSPALLIEASMFVPSPVKVKVPVAVKLATLVRLPVR